MIEALNLSGESALATLGSEESPHCTASTFISEESPRKLGINLFFKTTDENSDEENVLTVEGQGIIQSESSFYEEPDSPYQMPPLQRAPVLRDATNSPLQNHAPPAKQEKLNDLGGPSIQEIEESWVLEINFSTEFYSWAGQGSNSTSSRQR